MVVAFFCTKGLYVRNGVPGHLTDSQDFDSIVKSRKEKKRKDRKGQKGTEKSEKNRNGQNRQKKTEKYRKDTKGNKRSQKKSKGQKVEDKKGMTGAAKSFLTRFIISFNDGSV
jgi:hypothetical protein